MKFIPDCQVAWNQFQIFPAQTFSKYWHCYQIFLDMLFPHYEDMLSYLVNEMGKKWPAHFFLNITMYIFYVAACFLFKICLVYILLDLTQYTNIFFNKKPQVSRFKIFLTEKLYLKNSKIGRRREAGRIKKKALLKFNKHFELDISL